MRYARLATYEMTKGTFQELADIAEEGVLPLFAQQAGFIDYGLIDAGHGKVVSMSIWETKADAENATTAVATWVQNNIADRIRLTINYVGDLALFHGAPVTA
jgi:heme-degrading monooxygenase HmoA